LYLLVAAESEVPEPNKLLLPLLMLRLMRPIHIAVANTEVIIRLFHSVFNVGWFV